MSLTPHWGFLPYVYSIALPVKGSESHLFVVEGDEFLVDFEGDVGAILFGEEAYVHRVGHGDHFTLPVFDVVGEDDDAAEFAGAGADAEQGRAAPGESGFFFEFA